MPLSPSIDEIVDSCECYLDDEWPDADEPAAERLMRAGMRRAIGADQSFEEFLRACLPGEDGGGA